MNNRLEVIRTTRMKDVKTQASLVIKILKEEKDRVGDLKEEILK